MAATLADIRTKVRRLTRSPSESQITTAELDNYINDFLLYDFPEKLRLDSFRRTLTFYTTPNVDYYSTNTTRDDDPLYDFKNAYITMNDPVYIAGYQVYFTQSRNEFYNQFPALQASYKIGTGDGVTINFSGTLSQKPILPNNVLFSSINSDNRGLVLSDVPQIDGTTGYPSADGDLIWPDENVSRGTINYVTGVYDITFPSAPATGTYVYAQTVPYTAARPTTMLYFNQTFYLRPVPDQPYQVSIETFVRPTSLLDAADTPYLNEFGDYISFGAARKILIDRLDQNTLAIIEPEFKEHELLILRRTLVQQSNQRTATIYTQMVDFQTNGPFRNNY